MKPIEDYRSIYFLQYIKDKDDAYISRRVKIDSVGFSIVSLRSWNLERCDETKDGMNKRGPPIIGKSIIMCLFRPWGIRSERSGEILRQCCPIHVLCDFRGGTNPSINEYSIKKDDMGSKNGTGSVKRKFIEGLLTTVWARSVDLNRMATCAVLCYTQVHWYDHNIFLIWIGVKWHILVPRIMTGSSRALWLYNTDPGPLAGTIKKEQCNNTNQ